MADRKNPLSAILDDPLVTGASDLASRFGRYVGSGDALRDSAGLAVRMAPDLLLGGPSRVLMKRVAEPMAASIVEDFKRNPGRTVAENLPIVGGVMSALDAKELRQKAIEARARGDMDAYRRYSDAAAAAAGMLALGMIPVPGAAAGKAGVKAGVKAAEKSAAKAALKAGEGAVEQAERRGILNTPDLREMTMSEAFEAARGEPHIRSGPSGYVGAPAGVATPEDVANIRNVYDERVRAGVPGRDWYDKDRDFIAEVAGPDPSRQSLLARELGNWSPQATPDTNLNFALTAHNNYEAGTPLDLVRNTAAARNYNVARDSNVPIKLGKKTGPFAIALDPSRPAQPPGVNDIWQGRAFGYTNTGGETFDRAFTPQEHRFADYETVLAADRANAEKVGGFEDWTGPRVQASGWVAEKGRELAKKHFKTDVLTPEQEQWGIAQASQSFSDMAEKYTAFGTYEATPGEVTGHLPELTRVPSNDSELADLLARREEYAADPRTSWVDERSRDIVYDALGMYQRPTQRAQGVFVPSGRAEPEFNPAFVARPLVGRLKGGKGIEPGSRSLMEAAEAFRAALSGQESGAYHKPFFENAPGASGSVFVPAEGRQSIGTLQKLKDLGAQYGLEDIVDTGQGMTMTTFYPGPPSGVETGKALKGDLGQGIRDVVPGAEPRRAFVDSGYKDYREAWEAPQGSGAVTRQMLEYLEQSGAPNALERLDTPEIRARAKERMEADYEYAARTGQPVREDLQNLRRIIAERGPKALEAALGRKEFLAALPAALGLGAAMSGGLPSEAQPE